MSYSELERAYIRFRSFFARPRVKGRFHSFFIRSPAIVVVAAGVCLYAFLGFCFAFIYFKIAGIATMFEAIKFSFLTQTTIGASELLAEIPRWATYLSILQVVIGIFYSSVFVAIFIYKLINITPKIILFEKMAVFSPDDNTLRVRLVNRSRFPLIDLHLKMSLRMWLPFANRFAHIDINLKRPQISQFAEYSPWNIATRPISDLSIGPDPRILDVDRVSDFHPSLVSLDYYNKYAEGKDYLVLLITGQLPVFNVGVQFRKAFQISEIVCGKYRFVEDADIVNWTNWGMIDLTPTEVCQRCILNANCELKNNNRR